MTDLDSILYHSGDIVTKKTGNEYVLVPVTDNIADMNSVYTLNETGAFIWEHLDGRRSVGEIIDAVIAEYETDRETAASDVFGFINDMEKYLIIKKE